MNKFTLVAVTILICLLAYTVQSNADISEAASEYSGKCGDNATYTFNSSTGVLSISGFGQMADYAYASTYKSPPWYSYANSIKSINIGSSITSIGESAFSGCSYVTSVNISNSVTSISSYAFTNCVSLTSITIPNSVKYIGDAAFKGCTFLTSITFPSVETIGDAAFSGCIRLTYVEFSSSLTFINLTAFDDVFYDKDGVTAIPSVASNLAGSTFEKIDDKWVKQPDKESATSVYIIVGIIIVLGILALVVHKNKNNSCVSMFSNEENSE